MNPKPSDREADTSDATEVGEWMRSLRFEPALVSDDWRENGWHQDNFFITDEQATFFYQQMLAMRQKLTTEIEAKAPADYNRRNQANAA